MVALPRFHHQYLPDVVQYEQDAFSPAEIAALKERGHSLRAFERGWGNMQAVVWDRAAKRVEAAADPRVEGSAAVR